MLTPRRAVCGFPIGTRCLQTTSTPQARPFKILYLGRDEFSCGVLRELHAAKDVWDDIYVTTYPDNPHKRRKVTVWNSPLRAVAESFNLPVHLIPLEKSEFKNWQPPLPFSVPQPDDAPPPEHIVITASFGRILQSSLLRMFAPGRRFNIHPSLLPSLRGPAPIQHAILQGKDFTGVSVIEMLERKYGLDTGKIWGMSNQVAIPATATFASLRQDLSVISGQLLVSVLREHMAGKGKSMEQAEDAFASRASFITFEDSWVNFKTMTAEEIHRKDRAFGHQRPLTTSLTVSKTLQLHSTSLFDPSLKTSTMLTEIPGSAVIHPPTGFLLVRCADGSVLGVVKVKQQNKALMESRHWWNGAVSLGIVHDGRISLSENPMPSH